MTDNLLTLVPRNKDTGDQEYIKELVKDLSERVEDIKEIAILTIDKEGNFAVSASFSDRYQLIAVLELYKTRIILGGDND